MKKATKRPVKRIGRPPKEVSAEAVERLAAVWCTAEEIAAALGCSPDTLSRRFAECIKKGQAQGRASLRRRQWQAAEAGSTAMLIFLGKNLLGQRDRPEDAPDKGETVESLLERIARERGLTDERDTTN